MSCSTTENTLIRDYSVIQNSRLVITWALEAPAWVAMNLSGYEFRMEISKDKDFIDVTIPDIVWTISTNNYTFNVDFIFGPYAVGTYYYRVSMKDSANHLFPEAIRAWRFFVSK